MRNYSLIIRFSLCLLPNLKLVSQFCNRLQKYFTIIFHWSWLTLRCSALNHILWLHVLIPPSPFSAVAKKGVTIELHYKIFPLFARAERGTQGGEYVWSRSRERAGRKKTSPQGCFSEEPACRAARGWAHVIERGINGGEYVWSKGKDKGGWVNVSFIEINNWILNISRIKPHKKLTLYKMLINLWNTS